MVKTFNLSNGIQVAMEYMPQYRSVSLGVWVKAGSVNENDQNNGMAHVIEHMMFKGTRRRTARELADAMTEIGGNMDAYTTKEYTCYYAKTLHEHLYKAIDILGDMLTNSMISEEDLQKELGVIAEEIDMYDDSPEDIVHERLQEAVWQDHPLGYLISGEKSVIQDFHRQDVLDFMEEYYTASRMVISLSGYFNEEKVLMALETAFSSVPSGKNLEFENQDRALYYPSLYLQHKDIEQVHMIMAFDSIDYYDSERYILSVANNLLGGNVNSRLFQVIREDMGLAYAIYSYGSSYEKGGLFHIYAAVHPEQVRPVVLAVLNIIDELKRKPVTERELNIVKESVKTDLIISDESTYNRMSNYGKFYIHNETIVPVEEVAKAIEAVTAEDIQRFMQNHFDVSNFSLSLVGDLSSIPQPEMEQFWKACRSGKV
ncbi:MAG: M16 family metallopeptidase [Coprococcus sp.]